MFILFHCSSVYILLDVNVLPLRLQEVRMFMCILH